MTQESSRRKFLRRGGATLVTVAGVTGATGTAAASHPYNVTITANGSNQLYYEIHVTGDIASAHNSNDLESNDNDNGSWCSGYLYDGEDSWDFSGDVKEFVLDGAGDASFYWNGDTSNPTYKVDLFNEAGNNEVHYLWDQAGYISERNGSLESNDSITQQDDGTYQADGYIIDKADKFYADGSPDFVHLDDKDQAIHWYSFDR